MLQEQGRRGDFDFDVHGMNVNHMQTNLYGMNHMNRVARWTRSKKPIVVKTLDSVFKLNKVNEKTSSTSDSEHEHDVHVHAQQNHKQQKCFRIIALKMDVEGRECDVLRG